MRLATPVAPEPFKCGQLHRLRASEHELRFLHCFHALFEDRGVVDRAGQAHRVALLRHFARPTPRLLPLPRHHGGSLLSLPCQLVESTTTGRGNSMQRTRKQRRVRHKRLRRAVASTTALGAMALGVGVAGSAGANQSWHSCPGLTNAGYASDGTTTTPTKPGTPATHGGRRFRFGSAFGPAPEPRADKRLTQRRS